MSNSQQSNMDLTSASTFSGNLTSSSDTSGPNNSQAYDDDLEVSTYPVNHHVRKLEDLTLTKLGLRFAPPEIREKIFAHVFEHCKPRFPFHSSGTPALLKALYKRVIYSKRIVGEQHGEWVRKQQGDKELWEEARAAFFKCATFHVNWSFDERGDTENGDAIRRMRIQCSEGTSRNRHFERLGTYFGYFEGYLWSTGVKHDHPEGPSRSLIMTLSMAKNVTDLTLFFPHREGDVETGLTIIKKALRCIGSLSKLKKLSIGMVHDDFRDENKYYYDLKKGDLQFDKADLEKQCPSEMDIISHLNTAFGLIGEVEVAFGDCNGPTIIGHWEAKLREVLTLRNFSDIN